MAAPMHASIPADVDWLYPELLSKDGLLAILSQRYVKLPEDSDNTSRDSLLELYYKYIIPRPQRKYRLNRRGREMTKKQVLQAKKRRICAPDSSEPPAKRRGGESSRLLTSFDGISIGGTGNRLKPPPSCVNFEKKTIKLGSSSTSSSSASTSSSSSSTLQEKPTAISPTIGKVIKLNRSTSSSSSNDAKTPTSPNKTITLNKTVKLINSHLKSPTNNGDSKADGQKDGQEGSGESMETNNSESEPVKKKKFKKIGWP